MSVYPLYLVLGSDGTIGAYAREDVLKINLAENFKAGEPARAVWALNQHLITVTYERTNQFDEWVEPLDHFCGRHLRAALVPASPPMGICPACAQELAERHSNAAANR